MYAISYVKQWLQKVPAALYKYLFEKKKVFNLPELHFSEVTSYKIYTLVRKKKELFLYN